MSVVLFRNTRPARTHHMPLTSSSPGGSGLPIPKGWTTTTTPPAKKGNKMQDTVHQHIRDSLANCLDDPRVPETPIKNKKTCLAVKKTVPPAATMMMGNPLTLYNSLDEHLTSTPSVRKQQERDITSQITSTSMLDTIASAIRSSKTFDSRSKLCELNLDTVLSSTSYRNLMRQAFGTDGTVVAGMQSSNDVGIDIPMIARAFEENYMREPMGQESVPRGLGVSADSLIQLSPLHLLSFSLSGSWAVRRQIASCVLCAREKRPSTFTTTWCSTRACTMPSSRDMATRRGQMSMPLNAF